jgi:hypothetical protein
MKSPFRLLIVIILSLLSTNLWAGYTGLVIIPTNDYIGANTWGLGIQTQSTYFHTDQFVTTEFGIGSRCELGVDYYANPQSTDHRSYFNFKYMVVKDDNHKLYVSAGFYNMMSNGNAIPFITITKDFNIFRVHAGAQNEGLTDSKTNYLVGVDKIFSNGVQVMADYTHGNQNFTSAGAGWIGKRWQIFSGVLWPNAGGRPSILIRIIFTGKGFWGKK